MPDARQRGEVGQGRRGDRDQGNRDQAARNREDRDTGRAGPRVAVPRQGPAPRRDGDRNGYRDGDRNGYRDGDRNGARDGDRNNYRVYAPRGRVFDYYPRSSYYYPFSFGYGPAGRGHFYFDLHYDSYVWHPRTIIRYNNYGSYGNYGYPTGELRLQVRPREAQVFVDGYYAGTVDDFDGVFQSLRLEEGPYQIQIVLPGYEPLDFDVRIQPWEKVTYRGDLFLERR